MIRLARFGARKQPYYRIVAIEKDRARNGRSIEVVGTYNPRTNPATIDLKHDRIAYCRGARRSLIESRPGSPGRFLISCRPMFRVAEMTPIAILRNFLACPC
jgi:ribosomal protein S16